MSHAPRSWASSSVLPPFALAMGLAAAGCEDDKKISATPAETATAEPARKQALNGKLAAAVKAAESAQAPSARSENGPPEKGIFAPGAADKVIAAGAPAKVELLGEGAEPRVSLAYAPTDGEQKGSISVALRQQGRGAPVDYTLALKIDKPKGDKAKDEKKTEAPAGFRVVATVAAIALPAQAPREAADQFSKLKGSEIRYLLAPQGTMSEISFSLAKGADAGLEQALRQIVEGLGLVAPILPAKPIGAGGYWMVTDRPSGSLVDVVRYRVFRVEKVEKDRATLSIEIRQYAAKSEVDAGEGQKLTLDGFDSVGKGKTDWTAQGLLPAHSDTQVRASAEVRVQGAQGAQQARLQVETAVKVAGPSGEKDEKKK